MESERKSNMVWFRFYHEALNDPKVQRLPPHLFKSWVNLLCLASMHGGKLPSIDDIAFQLRVSAKDAEQQVSELILAGLIDIGATGATEPHNWKKRQFVSDNSTERVRKHRKQKEQRCDETERNVSCNASEAPPDTEQNRSEEDTEQIRVDAAPAKSQRQRTDSKRGSRLPQDWDLPADLRQWAQINFSSDDAAISLEAERFRDFWIAKPGQAGCKLDWPATWRNWCRNAHGVPATKVRRPVNEFTDRAAAKRAADRQYLESIGVM